jgi:hypothetical protein
LFGADQIDFGDSTRPRSGRRDRLDHLLSAAEPGDWTDEVRREFYDLYVRANLHEDELAKCQLAQVQSWVSAAIGVLMSGVLFAPPTKEYENFDWTSHILGRLRAAHDHAPSVGLRTVGREATGDDCLDVLFNARIGDGGIEFARTRLGQDVGWRYAWGWLGTDIEAEVMLPAVQLSARLLRCPYILEGILAALDHRLLTYDRMAVCVIRRWLLTLQILTWLEDALQRTWRWVRPLDLAVFGYSAVKPLWPRPLIALSHRSGDAKRVLKALGMWQSPVAAIDATYVPSWETNVAMIWGLFAASPVLVRVNSPTYQESLWCRREWEMAESLVTNADFLSSRRLIDIKVDELSHINDVVTRLEESRVRGREFVRDIGTPSFPMQSKCLVAHRLVDHQIVFLRAAGAVRIFHAVYRNPHKVNSIVDTLVQGVIPPMGSPTNNDDGWAAYVSMFRALVDAVGADPAVGSPLRLDGGTDEDKWAKDKALVWALPDFSGGRFDVRDLCAGLEWYRSFMTLFTDEGFGDHAVVDIRGVTAHEWERSPQCSHMRGLLGLNDIDNPIWVIQSAGQAADHWPGLSELPLFTEHLPDQYSWMIRGNLRSWWPLLHSETAGLRVSEKLLELLCSTVAPDEGGAIAHDGYMVPNKVFGFEP